MVNEQELWADRDNVAQLLVKNLRLYGNIAPDGFYARPSHGTSDHIQPMSKANYLRTASYLTARTSKNPHYLRQDEATYLGLNIKKDARPLHLEQWKRNANGEYQAELVPYYNIDDTEGTHPAIDSMRGETPTHHQPENYIALYEAFGADAFQGISRTAMLSPELLRQHEEEIQQNLTAIAQRTLHEPISAKLFAELTMQEYHISPAHDTQEHSLLREGEIEHLEAQPRFLFAAMNRAADFARTYQRPPLNSQQAEQETLMLDAMREAARVLHQRQAAIDFLSLSDEEQWKQGLQKIPPEELAEQLSWGLTYDDQRILLHLHQTGEASMQGAIEALLDECNFHTFQKLLAQKQYPEATEYIQTHEAKANAEALQPVKQAQKPQKTAEASESTEATAETETKPTTPALTDSIRDWYMANYPTDELGKELSSLSFGEILTRMNQGEDFYELMGVGDSLLRERLFTGSSLATGLPYDTFYNRYAQDGQGNTQEQKDIQRALNRAKAKAAKEATPTPKPDDPLRELYAATYPEDKGLGVRLPAELTPREALTRLLDGDGIYHILGDKTPDKDFALRALQLSGKAFGLSAPLMQEAFEQCMNAGGHGLSPDVKFHLKEALAPHIAKEDNQAFPGLMVKAYFVDAHLKDTNGNEFLTPDDFPPEQRPPFVEYTGEKAYEFLAAMLAKDKERFRDESSDPGDGKSRIALTYNDYQHNNGENFRIDLGDLEFANAKSVHEALTVRCNQNLRHLLSLSDEDLKKHLNTFYASEYQGKEINCSEERKAIQKQMDEQTKALAPMQKEEEAYLATHPDLKKRNQEDAEPFLYLCKADDYPLCAHYAMAKVAPESVKNIHLFPLGDACTQTVYAHMQGMSAERYESQYAYGGQLHTEYRNSLKEFASLPPGVVLFSSRYAPNDIKGSRRKGTKEPPMLAVFTHNQVESLDLLADFHVTVKAAPWMDNLDDPSSYETLDQKRGFDAIKLLQDEKVNDKNAYLEACSQQLAMYPKYCARTLAIGYGDSPLDTPTEISYIRGKGDLANQTFFTQEAYTPDCSTTLIRGMKLGARLQPDSNAYGLALDLKETLANSYQLDKLPKFPSVSTSLATWERIQKEAAEKQPLERRYIRYREPDPHTEPAIPKGNGRGDYDYWKTCNTVFQEYADIDPKNNISEKEHYNAAIRRMADTGRTVKQIEAIGTVNTNFQKYVQVPAITNYVKKAHSKYLAKQK